MLLIAKSSYQNFRDSGAGKLAPLKKEMMEKIDLKFADSEEKEITILYGDDIVKVSTFISLNLQSVFIQEYCNTLLDITVPRENRVVNAELQLKMQIVDFQTNIALSEDFSLNGLLQSGVYHKIIEGIDNYDDFRALLDESVKFVLGDYSVEKSIGGGIDVLIQKLTKALDVISDIDFSKEGLAELTGAILKTQKDFDDKWGTDTPAYDIVAPGQLELGSAEVVEEPKAIVEVEEAPKKKPRKPHTPKSKE